MPELPDVEFFRTKCTPVIGERIDKVKVNYDRLLQVSREEIKRALLDRKFDSSDRHGKYLLLHFEDEPSLMLHFGMTGTVEYYNDHKPDHIAMNLSLTNGDNFAVISVRKLGQIDIVNNHEHLMEKYDLGPDALDLGEGDFMDLVKDSRGYIKTSLTDQSRIAGLGNIYTDEILFHARVHPQRKIKDIEEEEFKIIYSSMLSVLKAAIKAEVDPSMMPENYLIGERNEEGKCNLCGADLAKIKVGGRSTYFCPQHQV